MRETEYAFAVAKVRANESSLLTAADLEGLIAAKDLDAALKLLTDLDYADFSLVDIDEVLKQKEKSAFEFICDIAPDKNLFDFLIVKNDFHNIKAVLKAIVSNVDYSPFVLEPCLVEPEIIKTAVEEKNFSLLPDWAVEPVKQGFNLLTETMDGQRLDIYLDKQYLTVAFNMAKESKEEFSFALVNRQCAIANMLVVSRAAEMGKEKAFIKDALVPCDLFDNDRLVSAALEGKKELAEYIKESGFTDVSENLLKGMVAFERSLDDLLIDFVTSARYQSFGVSPLIAYYLAKVSEIKTIRILISLKRCGMGEKEIRERVRKLYV